MNEILVRIREVFDESGKSQTQIGKMIEKTPQYVWKLLNVDDANPSKDVIKAICRNFNISYLWLTQGIEPKEATENTDAMTRIDDIMAGENEFAKSLFKEFSKLDDNEWKLLEEIIKKLANDKGD
ncbi:MAG: helix-turn-helix transcriptional regulator [Roseburia sp.]|nr:helix-turn-helix transcriptional regulator [Roseburia sp.]